MTDIVCLSVFCPSASACPCSPSLPHCHPAIHGLFLCCCPMLPLSVYSPIILHIHACLLLCLFSLSLTCAYLSMFTCLKARVCVVSLYLSVRHVCQYFIASHSLSVWFVCSSLCCLCHLPAQPSSVQLSLHVSITLFGRLSRVCPPALLAFLYCPSLPVQAPPLLATCCSGCTSYSVVTPFF